VCRARISVSARLPANRIVTEGQAAQFSVTANGTGLLYQGRRGGINVAGAAGTAYTTPAITSADNGAVFAVVVHNRAGSVTSVDYDPR
jgi:large repetitive protein